MDDLVKTLHGCYRRHKEATKEKDMGENRVERHGWIAIALGARKEMGTEAFVGCEQ